MLWRRVRGARWAVGAVVLAGLALLPLMLYQNEHVLRAWAEGLSVKDELAEASCARASVTPGAFEPSG
jgi:hypothetical protein